MEILVLGAIVALVLVAVTFAALCAAGLLVVKLVWWLVTLPFRILMALLWVPLAVLGAVLVPLGVVLLVAIVGVAAALLLPVLVLPLIALGAIVWLFVVLLTPATV